MKRLGITILMAISRWLFLASFIFGFGGFFLGSFLPMAGDYLNHIELPIVAETQTVELPDGSAVTATMPTARIQHYDRNGRFQRGWFVHSAGGMFSVRWWPTGHIAVCSVRTNSLELFDLNGTSIDKSRTCDWGADSLPSLINWRLRNLNRTSESGAGPRASAQALALVPLWHPFVAWAMAAVGLFVWRIVGVISERR
jgi:hypothetical protein